MTLVSEHEQVNGYGLVANTKAVGTFSLVFFCPADGPTTGRTITNTCSTTYPKQKQCNNNKSTERKLVQQLVENTPNENCETTRCVLICSTTERKRFPHPSLKTCKNNPLTRYEPGRKLTQTNTRTKKNVPSVFVSQLRVTCLLATDMLDVAARCFVDAGVEVHAATHFLGTGGAQKTSSNLLFSEGRAWAVSASCPHFPRVAVWKRGPGHKISF